MKVILRHDDGDASVHSHITYIHISRVKEVIKSAAGIIILGYSWFVIFEFAKLL